MQRSCFCLSLLLTLIALGFIAPTPALAYQAEPIAYTQENASVIIEAYAAHNGIPAAPLIATLACESKFNPASVGDHGTSFGVAQIHLPAHPEITKTQALDPLWAIDWTAKEFALGHQGMWSCYRALYGGSSG